MEFFPLFGLVWKKFVTPDVNWRSEWKNRTTEIQQTRLQHCHAWYYLLYLSYKLCDSDCSPPRQTTFPIVGRLLGSLTAVVTAFFYGFLDRKMAPFDDLFAEGTEKLARRQVGKWGDWSIRNWRMLNALWAAARNWRLHLQ